MKSKRLFCIALAVLTALTLCACGRNGGEPAATPEPEAAATAVCAALDTEAVPEETPLPVLNITVCELEKDGTTSGLPIPNIYEDQSIFEGASGTVIRMESVLQYYPTDAIRQKEDGLKYAVYETDNGCRQYVFFHHLGDDPNLFETPCGFPVFICKTCSYGDFVSLNAGDPIGCVESIDPVAGYVAETVKKLGILPQYVHGDTKGRVSISSVHYLTDGILKISYDMAEDGTLFIIDIVYSADYTLDSVNGKTINYRIYPEDLPQF